ncbi:NADPH-dependent diflavin oxidoreductase 1-like [Pyrus ussuriensis x Pyrus communis]|uniref:NADPH-dependent diflavin oxidoreductase 1-like n=1 Tax=Pyrus ussuriensis x Pyrus communis TaxID=2448454 RepID=A0A5N5GK91_9ROSA|nr:NADPH-dependent diflavin oxidoreductase 1-like [Pyrus ussuriensis x Pyrus communis]
MEEERVRKKLLILYATQTGNALDVAERVSREAERRGCPVHLLSLDQYDAGDTPDPMKGFWKDLLQKNLSRQWLEGLRYAVFGLGDSGYQKFNFVAKKLDRRLWDLGATPIVQIGLGDDQHPSGNWDDVFSFTVNRYPAVDLWMASLWNTLNKIDPNYFPNGPDFLIPYENFMAKPKVQILYHDIDRVDSQVSSKSDLNHMALQIERACRMSPLKFSLDRPDCILKLVKNEPLTKSGCKDKEVHHFEFEFVSSPIPYEVGDVLEVLPSQNPAAVDAFILCCNLDPESFITVMSMFASAEHEKERLKYFVSPEGRDDLYQYNQREQRTVLEVLGDFPSVQLPFEWLIRLVPPLKRRAFSISSSPSAHLNQVHLTVNVVSWTTLFKTIRAGLCVYVPVWFQKGSLPPPRPSLPLILIGPGTGCAPFRGFVEERAIQSLTESTGPVIFFFGCRNEDNDFWLSNSQDGGVLSEAKGGGFLLPSKRPVTEVYVQDKMREHSQKLWKLLMEGVAIYIAGSSTKMPADVLLAFEEIIYKESELPQESAVRWVRELEKAGRYYVEAWS